MSKRRIRQIPQGKKGKKVKKNAEIVNRKWYNSPSGKKMPLFNKEYEAMRYMSIFGRLTYMERVVQPANYFDRFFYFFEKTLNFWDIKLAKIKIWECDLKLKQENEFEVKCSIEKKRKKPNDFVLTERRVNL